MLHPPAESSRPAPTRVTPEHYITSLGQHGIALDTHVVRASLLRLSHNKRVLTRPCVALTASTAAGMTYGPTTILMSAPLPENAAEVRHSSASCSSGTLVSARSFFHDGEPTTSTHARHPRAHSHVTRQHNLSQHIRHRRFTVRVLNKKRVLTRSFLLLSQP